MIKKTENQTIESDNIITMLQIEVHNEKITEDVNPLPKLENNNEIKPVMKIAPIRGKRKSHLDIKTKDPLTNQIMSEIARIGHDFAYGKKPEDLFRRIEKEMPVVFTLQDDVGDTPLNNALLQGNLASAEYILEIIQRECSWALNLSNTSGHTALILAPACDIPGTFVAKLLEAGCKLDIVDYWHKSAITYAIEYQNASALEAILDFV